MFNLAIVKGEKAFLPEAYAYEQFFSKKSHIKVHIYPSVDSVPDNVDLVIVFYGFIPKWRSYKFEIIGEYNSLSTGVFAKLKDLIKRVCNKRGTHTVVLNDYVRKQMFLNTDVLIRGMGFFTQYLLTSNIKKFDLVYSGTINRPGVKDVLVRLSGLGLSVCVIGTSEYIGCGVISLGRLSLQDVYKVYGECTYGLNFTPDIYPYNRQDSTKVIEYCAAGLKVITNKYDWIDKFEVENNACFLDVDKISTIDDLFDFGFKTPNVEHLDWERVIVSSGLDNLIEQKASIKS
jgi:hypothetical protein